MTWTLYLTFLAFAAVVVIAPGPDFAVTVKNALSGGRGTGLAAAAGITTSNLVHGTVAAVGLGALLVASHQVFTAVRWIGAAYLCYLAFQALRSAWKGSTRRPPRRTAVGAAWRAAGRRASCPTSPTRRSWRSTCPCCRSSWPAAPGSPRGRCSPTRTPR
ncbi:LysE family translocator [Nocardiopsis composta]